MSSPQLVGSVLLWLVGCAIFVSPAAAEIQHAFHSAKRSIQLQLGSKRLETRIAGIRELKEYPLVDAAKLLLQLGFNGQPAEVRSAAYEALLKLSDNVDVADYLNAIVRAAPRGKPLADEMRPIVAALLASELSGVDRDSLELIEKSATSAKYGLVSLTTLADELGAHNDDADLRALGKLTKTKAFADNFVFRRAVTQAIIRIHTPESIELLIALMAKVNGEVRGDAVDILQKATGQTFADDHVRWADWWQTHKTEFRYPALPADGGPRSLLMSTSPGYDGEPIYGNRVVFMLDVSGTMNWGDYGWIATAAEPRKNDFRQQTPLPMRRPWAKLAAAKRELIYAIGRLDKDATFNVIIFNSGFGSYRGVSMWEKRLQRATPQLKREASVFIEPQHSIGHVQGQPLPPSFPLMETAFKFDPESIYIFTDGEANANIIRNADEVFADITKVNRTRRVSIHILGIGAGEPGGRPDEFLRKLAEQNFGTYRRVDE